MKTPRAALPPSSKPREIQGQPYGAAANHPAMNAKSATPSLIDVRRCA
jgi:hypothetical protein